jgi:hypothetical protein
MDDKRKVMKQNLEKLVKNEYLDSSAIYLLQLEGLVRKITFSQYVLTEKGYNQLKQ